ncbi:MAG TPA: hypothetical protein VJU84_16650 [Pyrinomonadaceae bacterium]|nr:hypothetical protein [Pyrinomonadaceae bacterium]
MNQVDAVEHLRQHLLDLIRPIVTGRVVILAGITANNDSIAEFFRLAGATDVISLELLPTVDTPIHLLFSRTETLFKNPPASVESFLSTIDRKVRAVVYAGSFCSQSSLCGRKIIGARKAAHSQAERKDRQLEYGLVDQAANMPRILDFGDEKAAWEIIDKEARDSPIVVSGIPDKYLAMGSSHTYLVYREPGDQPDRNILHVIGVIARDCRKGLISRLDRGTPCTFYGYVSRNWFIEFGAFEGLVFWNRKTLQLSAPGIIRPIYLEAAQHRIATEAIQNATRRLYDGTHYTGAFCTDGIMQSHRYLIHEINPRVCAGFSLLGELCHGRLPLTLIDLALRERPIEADVLLREPLKNVAPFLRTQGPLIKLWDTRLAPVQEDLRARATETADVTGWISQVRRVLASDHLIPVVDHE